MFSLSMNLISFFYQKGGVFFFQLVTSGIERSVPKENVTPDEYLLHGIATM